MIGLLDRIGRPLLRLCGVVFVVVVIWFIVRLMAAITVAYDRAAVTGQNVPDMSGGLGAILTPILASLPVIIPMAIDQITRHRERRDQIARGEAPPPFGGRRQPPPAPPSQEWTGVNPHGGPGAP